MIKVTKIQFIAVRNRVIILSTLLTSLPVAANYDNFNHYQYQQAHEQAPYGYNTPAHPANHQNYPYQYNRPYPVNSAYRSNYGQNSYGYNRYYNQPNQNIEQNPYINQNYQYAPYPTNYPTYEQYPYTLPQPHYYPQNVHSKPSIEPNKAIQIQPEKTQSKRVKSNKVVTSFKSKVKKKSIQIPSISKVDNIPKIIKTNTITITKREPKFIQNKSHKKSNFIKKVLPLIVIENKKILSDRNQLIKIINKQNSLTKNELIWLKNLKRKYKFSGRIRNNTKLQKKLLSRVNTIPEALALAQAANESAWGTSRFAKQGNNLFGIWTYNEKNGIKPRKREKGKKHFVRKFDSIQKSVAVYLNTLNTHAAYKKLRSIRDNPKQQVSALNLLAGLENYSELGLKYISLIKAIIIQNKFEKIISRDLVML